jgi:hypothetical protein
MTPWMFILNPFERWGPMLDDFEGVFDLWQEGGVRGIVIGRLVFTAADGSTVPTFAHDPEVYSGFGVEPPPPQGRDLPKEKRFVAMLDNAAARGWQVMVFEVHRNGGGRPAEEDPHGAVQLAAAAQDVMQAYPQAHGVILDGPGENPYELHPHRNREFLALGGMGKRFGHLGYDMDRIERGITHLRAAFQDLTPGQVRYWSPGGALGALQLFDVDEDVLYWLRARRHATSGWMEAVRTCFDRFERPVQLGVIPRSSAFSGLTGQNYTQLAKHVDYVFPKHYFWHRGFDGMYGTVWRWVRQIAAWNPSLSQQDCFDVVKLWFGLELPGVHSLADMEGGFPEEFFTEVVFRESARAMAAVGDPDKVIAWVSSGRLPHGGDMMPARDLEAMLKASKAAGIERFVFHATHLLGAAEWTVMSRFCGTPWQDDGSFEWPADADHNVINFSGRA